MSSLHRKSSVPSIQELRASRGHTPSFLQRFRRWLIAVGVAVSMLLFGFFGLPPIVKAQAIKQLSARLGRAVTIERIRLNPLVLSVTIEGFAIAEPKPSAGEFTGWRRLYVNLDSWALFTGEIRFQKIVLDGFTARISRAQNGAFNFADIVERFTKSGEDNGASTGASPVAVVRAKPLPVAASVMKARPLRVAVDELAVTNARVSFDDVSGQRPFSSVVGPLTFNLKKFRTVGDAMAPFAFEAVTAVGERFAWKGTLSADPLKSEGELALSNIDLVHLSPYFHQFIRGELRSGLVDVSGRYGFEFKDGGPALTLSDGSFALREVRFGAPGVEADAFALKRFAITGAAADSVTRKVAISKIAVEGVQLKVTRDAEGIDLLRLIAPVPASAGGAASATASVTATTAVSATGTAEATPSLPAITLAEFSLSGVQVDVTDLTTPRRAEHRVEDITLTLRDIDSLNLAKPLPLSLVVQLPQEGRIALIGTASPQPLAAALEVTLARVPFANVSPYVESFLNIRLSGGVLRTQGTATLRDGTVTFAGDLGVAGFAAVDGKLAQDFVKWTDFAVTGIRMSSAPLAFHADEIRFVEPNAVLRVEADGTINALKAAGSPRADVAAGAGTAAGADVKKASEPAGKVSAPGQSPESPMPVVTIGRFAFEKAVFRLEDRSIKPAARGGITDFTGSITGLSSDALGRADVDLHGKVDGVAPVSISGKLNPLGKPAFVDVAVNFQGIDLQPGAGPYIRKFVGRELTRGNLNIAVKAKLEDRTLDTHNVVTLDQFYLGAKTDSPVATKLPVGLALALLRDTDGKIVIDLPIKGSIDDPDFKVGHVVVRVLVNILTKAATSPFSLLGAAFGGGGEELGWQDFAEGASALDASSLKKLQTVAKALGSRPALTLDIVGAYDSVRDLDALRRERLERQLRVAAWEQRRLLDPATPPAEAIEITPGQRLALMTKLYLVNFPLAVGAAVPRVVTGEGADRVEVPLIVPAPSADDGGRHHLGRLQKYGALVAKAKVARVAAVPAKSPVKVSAAVGVEVGGAANAPTLTLAEMEVRLAGMIEIPEADLQALGEARAKGVRGWLLETGKVPAERMFLSPVVATGTRVNLNLK